MILLTAPRVLAAGGLIEPGWVLHDHAVRELGEGEPPAHVRRRASDVRALPEGVLAPGFVDLQVNGAFGVDFATAGDEDWARVARQLATTGVTAFAPTLISAPIGELAAGVRRYRDRRPDLDRTPGAARTLGLHLEGPFLSEQRRGAHRADLLRDPSPERVGALLEAGGDALAYVTLAPERRGGLEAIRRLTGAGVRVAIGHSDADEATVYAAADAGATLVTHLYNAQRPLRHRDPGTVGAALVEPRLACGLIVDLHHVAPAAVRIAFVAAAGRVVLVSDAVAALGMPAGAYELGGERVDVRPGQPPRRRDGTLAGSTLRMDEAVANAVDRCGVDLVVALEAASRVPARAIGRVDLGVIAPGADADLVWLDGDLWARATWVAGVPLTY